MSARLIDGKAVASLVRDQVSREVSRLQESTGVTPGLAVVLVGEVPASQVYVRNKEKAARMVGIRGRILRLPSDTTESGLLGTIAALNADPDVHGILVQLPLPRGIDEGAVIRQIDPRKDVDGFHPENVGLLTIGAPRFVPCTPQGVRELLLHERVETHGARAIVIGRSNIVGKPMALLLLAKGPGGDATVTVCHTGTRDLPALCREADVLIAAAGRPEFVRGDWIKPGAVVIDVGIHQGANGRLVGDVAFREASERASMITPVPGGVGPMTVAMLLRNTLQAARLLS